MSVHEGRLERVIAGGACAVFGALAWSACQPDDVRPVVVTDRFNMVVDMPSGVRWDVEGFTFDECMHSGGAWDGEGVCTNIDD